uniref:Uncharacterized protein n=1 Tax=Tanacetum cinerariifolium TaxID=118510 RepID=A0A6L2MRM9_TANCI|nr:hypothetical protein [Tanacetum cinerariifolium]
MSLEDIVWDCAIQFTEEMYWNYVYPNGRPVENNVARAKKSPSCDKVGSVDRDTVLSSTQDRLRQWDVGPVTDLNLLRGPFRDKQLDSHNLLFFECPFPLQILSRVRVLGGMDNFPPRAKLKTFQEEVGDEKALRETTTTTTVDEHEIGDGYLSEKHQQLVIDEEALRKTLEEETRSEKQWEERIRQEQAHGELYRLEFGVKSDSKSD